MNEQKFIVDAMLGNIARKLRFFGYDTKYFPNIDDREIIILAKHEGRTILTRDRDLSSKATKEKIQSTVLESVVEVEQLIQIAKHYSIKKFAIDFDKIRCSLCNEKIASIKREDILKKIPIGVIDHSEFWICKKCDKIYWKGTHIEKLVQYTKMLNEKMQ
ncbi:MAG: hypothetical protein DWQ18_00055 [Crenarchaeota archaeon]|nr:MAG: hypothetical protein DWQ17_05160 [Thermoproteota archaeon]RDJ34385.1 MAG: hypothetical protein DWQ18_00055 [Thermoproteota archaeon]RDJ34723.1 MAG: hypothetical protein DWQ19_13170 [Thermoproteota archaeon]RDJ38676.1 MAG: hypothetical protein DWQ13_04765 [Thermoproteota archaeon]